MLIRFIFVFFVFFVVKSKSPATSAPLRETLWRQFSLRTLTCNTEALL